MAEYIDKQEAYLLLKDLEAAYIYPPVKEAYATAARHIDQMKAADVQPTERGKYTNVIKVLDKRVSYFGNLNRNIEEEREMFALKVAIEVLTKLNGGAQDLTI